MKLCNYVEVNDKFLSQYTRKQLFDMMKNSEQFYRDPEADKKINEILDEHGIRNSIPTDASDIIKPKQPNKDGVSFNRGKQRKGNPKS